MSVLSQGALLFQTLALVLLAFSPAAQAGVIEVRPTLLAITAAQRIAILSVVNPEDSAAVYQVQIYRWRQTGDTQRLEPTDDMIASPPMISLPAHGTQLVRIGLRSGAVPEQEAAYRLILEEVPAVNPLQPHQLNIALHVSLPLFARPQPIPPPPRLAATLRLTDKNAIVTVYNTGAFTARIIQANLNFHSDDGNRPEAKGLVYILPNGWNTYSFPLPAAPASLQNTSVTLQTDEGDIDIATQIVSEAISDASLPAAH